MYICEYAYKDINVIFQVNYATNFSPELPMLHDMWIQSTINRKPSHVNGVGKNFDLLVEGICILPQNIKQSGMIVKYAANNSNAKDP